MVFIVLGWLMLLGGAAMVATAAVGADDVGVLLGVGGGGLSLGITGVVVLLVARYFKTFLGADALDEPVAGTAVVLTVTDTGTTINNVNAVLMVHATLTVALGVFARRRRRSDLSIPSPAALYDHEREPVPVAPNATE